jgi:hypothetical protein
MQLRAGDTVNLTNANLGFSSKVFEVIAWSLSSDGTPPTPVIELQLRETAASVYDWDVADEVAVESAPNTTLPNPFSIDPPTNLTLTADGTTQFIQADGTVVPRIKVAWSAPTEQFVTSGGKTVIEYKEGTATTYLVWSTVDGDQTLDFISSDVRIGTSYNVRLYAQSFFNTSSTYTAVSTTTPVKDTTAPSIPTGLAAVVGTGRAVSLDWNDNTEPDFSEYGIYRLTSPVTASALKIAEVRASRFVDTDVDIGTTYYYWLNAYDTVENVSGFAPYVEATPVVITAGPIDSTPPSTPSAPTYVSESTYLSSDGGTFAKITIAAPVLPSGARVNQVLYKISGSTDFLIACELTAAGNATIDDLTVGASYVFAIRAVSFSNVRSTVSTTLSRTAPSNTTAPAAPTGGTFTGDGVKPKYFTGTLVFLVGTRIGWAPNTESDFDYYEIKATTTNSDAATDYSWTPFDGANFFVTTRDTETFLYTSTIGAGYIRIRAVNRSGVASSWASLGNANSAASVGTGTVSKYNDSDVTTTGIKTGGGSSTLQVNVVYEVNTVVTLTGGSTTENVNISLTNRGFSAKPDDGLVVVEDVLYQGFYDSQSGSSSSTNAVIKIYRNDGGTLASGNLRLSARFTDYN